MMFSAVPFSIYLYAYEYIYIYIWMIAFLIRIHTYIHNLYLRPETRPVHNVVQTMLCVLAYSSPMHCVSWCHPIPILVDRRDTRAPRQELYKCVCIAFSLSSSRIHLNPIYVYQEAHPPHLVLKYMSTKYRRVVQMFARLSISSLFSSSGIIRDSRRLISSFLILCVCVCMSHRNIVDFVYTKAHYLKTNCQIYKRILDLLAMFFMLMD